MSLILNLYRCAFVAVLLARGHKFDGVVTSHPGHFQMVFIFEPPYQDLDVFKLVTVFVRNNPLLVYHLLHILTLVSADERLTAECVIEF